MNSNSTPDQDSDHISTDLAPSDPGNFGFLQFSSLGHVRFVPLPSQWNPVLHRDDAGNHFEGLSDVPHDEDAGFPFNGCGRITKAELLALLPPRKYCAYLKGIYFKVFSPLFHILHDPTFEEEYERFHNDADSVSLGWLALLFIILGIAVTALDDDDPILSDLGHEKSINLNIRVVSSRYRSAAMKCLAADGVMTRHSMSSLQALVLTLYARSHMNIPTWTLLGFTHHVAIAMGCHIDPGRFNLSILECEQRRRAWAALMMIYTIQNTALGSFGHRPFSQDTKPPSDVDDVDLMTAFNKGSQGGPTQMTYILLKFRLYEISAKISETLLSRPDGSPTTLTQLENEVASIQAMCTSRYRSDNNRSHLPGHHMANYNIIQGYTHQLRLLIHRPNFTRYFQGDRSQAAWRSKDRCVESAKSLLAIYRNLSECPVFAPYKWYTSGLGSFYAFHAAVSLAAVLMEPDNQNEYDEIKGLLSNSLDLFAALSHRSSVCEKAVTILQNLIDVANSRRCQVAENTTYVSGGTDRSVAYNESESPMASCHIEMMFSQLQPQNWLSPAAISWDGWDFLSGDGLVAS
ncbi:transcriptional regulator family: Fungal Specific TF [Paecilomyces variotii]|nr:transcriptional regulator family: Fungal Specific TF [Paecilomyces variotii]KAJ9288763.1 transcriptional regulator family: Fungal Specific TF [Paecilomyces variotii]